MASTSYVRKTKQHLKTFRICKASLSCTMESNTQRMSWQKKQIEKVDERDQAEQGMKEQQQYMVKMKAKMSNADAATKIMKEIMDISHASQDKVRELREKLQEATGKEASEGAEDAVASQDQAIDDELKNEHALQQKLSSLQGCETCADKAQHMAELEEQLDAAKKEVTKSEGTKKTIEVSAKASVQKAAAARMKSMQDEMADAKAKLLDLENEALEADKEAGSAGMGPVKLKTSKSIAVADAAVHQEIKVADDKEAEAKKRYDDAENDLVHYVERKTKKAEETAEMEAAAAAEGKSHNVAGKVKERLKDEENKYGAQKKTVEADAKKLKAMAIQAVAQGDVVKLAQAQADTAKAMSALHKTQKAISLAKTGVSDALEAGVFGVMHAKNVAKAQVAAQMKNAKKLAETHTTPALQQMKADGEGAEKRATKEITTLHTKVKEMLNNAATTVGAAMKMEGAATGALAKKKQEDAARQEEMNMKQKTEGLASPTEAKKMAVKMEGVQEELLNADQAVEKAAAKAARISAEVQDIAKAASVPDVDILSTAQQMIAVVGKRMSEMSGVVSQNTDLSETQTEQFNQNLSMMKSKKSALQEAVVQLRKEEEKKHEAEKQQKDAQLALSFRTAIEKVEKMKVNRKENQKKVDATNKLMAEIDQRMASETSAQWKQRMNEKLSGPSVNELEKEQSEIKTKIELAKGAQKEEDATIEKIQDANVIMDQANAAHAKLMDELRAAQAQIDKMPRGNSPEKIDLLNKIDVLSQKEITANTKLKAAKTSATRADTITPKVQAAKAAMDKFTARINDARTAKSKLNAALGMKEAAMKKGGPDLEKDTQAVVKSKENLVKMTQDLATLEKQQTEARQTAVREQQMQKRAEEAVTREKDEKVDAKNTWVKDMVHYAQKEKGMKKTGAAEQEKHVESLIKKNTQKEIDHKSEVSTKQEKTAKAEEVKGKAHKRSENVDKEKETKGTELETKEEINDKEKTNKAGIAGELKNKRAEELVHKQEQKVERQEKGQVAARDQEVQAKLLVKYDEEYQVAKENNKKKMQEFDNAKQAEIAGRSSSESAKKQKIKALDDEINAAAGQSTEAFLQSAKASKVQTAENQEEGQKDALKKTKDDARKASDDAAKEFVTGKELKSKSTLKENEAKAESNAIALEIDQKDKTEKANKESATKADEATNKKEQQVKFDKDAAITNDKKKKEEFKVAHEKLKHAESVLVDTQNRFKENEQKYEKFEKERAATAQRNALQDLARAQSELNKDERLFQGSKTKEEERHYGSQVKDDQRILKEKQATADRDEHLVEQEKNEKKSRSEEEAAVVNSVARSETAYISTVTVEEKVAKAEIKYKNAVDKLNQQAIEAQDGKEKAEKSLEFAERATGRATNEVSFKDAKTTYSAAQSQMNEINAKTKAVEELVNVEGKKNEEKAKESTVKEKTAKFDKDKANQAMHDAVHDRNSEMSRKQAERTNAASGRHLRVKQVLDSHVEEFRMHAEKALKGIQNAETEKGFKRRVAEEKEEKKEFEAAKIESEKNDKGGANEMERKKDDKDLYVQLKEKDTKARHARNIADAKANEAGATEQARLAAFKEERDADELNSKANERVKKTLAKVPGNAKNSNQTKTGTNPVAKPKPTQEKKLAVTQDKEDDKDSNSPDPDEDPNKKPAQNFTSVYEKLATEESGDSVRRRRSWHRRRRWVARRRVGGKDGAPDQGKTDAPKTKGAAKQPGFSASFWSGVSDAKTVGDAIIKISNKPATIKQTVDVINYPLTEGYWIGLDNAFQNSFFARFRGHINVPLNGTYTFFVRSDDGSMLFVNGNNVVNNDGVHQEMEEAKGDIKLETGIADVVIDFFAGQGKNGLIVEWKGPGMERQRLSDKYVHEPAKDESVRESMMSGELQAEIAAETKVAEMSQEAMEYNDMTDLGSSDIISLL